jgi:cellobiose phosphorylase
LCVSPCLPASWDSFNVAYYCGATEYTIKFRRTTADASVRVTFDGVAQADGCVSLADDGVAHEVVVDLPAVSSREDHDD